MGVLHWLIGDRRRPVVPSEAAESALEAATAKLEAARSQTRTVQDRAARFERLRGNDFYGEGWAEVYRGGSGNGGGS